MKKDYRGIREGREVLNAIFVRHSVTPPFTCSFGLFGGAQLTHTVRHTAQAVASDSEERMRWRASVPAAGAFQRAHSPRTDTDLETIRREKMTGPNTIIYCPLSMITGNRTKCTKYTEEGSTCYTCPPLALAKLSNLGNLADDCNGGVTTLNVRVEDLTI